MITRPLLAESVTDLKDLEGRYPFLCSYKLDGIRALKVGGKLVTRKFKEVPNKYIRNTLTELLPDGIDGEIMSSGGFNSIQSKVMSEDGEPDFFYNAFDYVKDDLTKPYAERIEDLKQWYKALDRYHHINLVLPTVINNLGELINFETQALDTGHEGVMLRSAQGRYKCGRSTLREGILLKLKRFKDSEAEVIGFLEKMHNTNPSEVNELGLSKRSSKKEGLVGASTLGTLLVRDIYSGVEFGIGSGFDDAMRVQIWYQKEFYLGKTVKYKYQEVAKDAPRFPVFLGFRNPLDL